MRILLHDYAGHQFPLELSRALARRGHIVRHLYAASIHTPRGQLTLRADEDETISIDGIELNRVISKYRFVQRFLLESKYGTLLVSECQRFQPEVVLSANTPSLSQVQMARWCRSRGVRLVSWIQDCYGLAAYRILSKKLPGVGHLVGKYMMALDRESALASHAVVAITDDFIPYFERNGIPKSRLHVIQNWAPLESLTLAPKDNDWAAAHHLDPERVRFLYSGTLAIKHDTHLLVQLGAQLQEWGNGELVVVSEGPAIESVKRRAAELGLTSVRCLPFQPFEQMSSVLGCADVLVSILNRDAGVYCVPSKVLSYMCAGRAQLVAMPLENLAARIVQQNGIGAVSRPEQASQFLENARALFVDQDRRNACGTAARAYAEAHFDLDEICSRFENVLGVGKELGQFAAVR
jgi:colanic acid biosynthesis glycosyl transferase WcaI